MRINKGNIDVAVKQANGCSKIPDKISLLAELMDKLESYDTFGGFLVFCDTDLNTKEEIRNDFSKKEAVQEFYSDKVQFGAISTVLKPDKPIRFAIKDKLIKSEYLDKYMELPEFKDLHNFLQNNLVS